MEYAPSACDLVKTSGTGSVVTTLDGVSMTGNCWVRNIVNDGYVEIPAGDFYYDIVYSNTAGNKLYIGWEVFDANKTSTSNSSTFYLVNTTGAAQSVRVKGVRSITQDSGGRTAKYIRIRILNSWENTSGSSSISFISLRNKSTTTRTLSVDKKTVAKSDTFVEESGAHAYKNGIMGSTSFYEI